MSWGYICNCDSPQHPMDPRSVTGELGITDRCRRYSADQEVGGLCVECATGWHEREHRAAAPAEAREEGARG